MIFIDGYCAFKMDYILIIITIYVLVLSGIVIWLVNAWPKRIILATTTAAILIPLWLFKGNLRGGLAGIGGGELVDANPSPTPLLDTVCNLYSLLLIKMEDILESLERILAPSLDGCAFRLSSQVGGNDLYPLVYLL